MFWSLVGVVVGCIALLVWLRTLTPDPSTRPLTSAPRPSARAASSVAGQSSQRAARATLGARAPGLKSEAQPYAALSIKPGANGCGAAADLSNVRYLEDTAPHLPLSDCDRLACNCTFQRHADRRRNEQGERRTPREAIDADAPATERRQLHGRRITDRS